MDDANELLRRPVKADQSTHVAKRWKLCDLLFDQAGCMVCLFDAGYNSRFGGVRRRVTRYKLVEYVSSVCYIQDYSLVEWDLLRRSLVTPLLGDVERR